MTKEQFEIFRDKQNELYAKYENSKDPNAYENMNKEWLEFIKNFGQVKSQQFEKILDTH